MITNHKKQNNNLRQNDPTAQDWQAAPLGSNRRAISMYDQPPQEVIGIHEFQQIAISRLQVLKKIQFLYDSNKDAYSEQLAMEINKFTKQHKLNVEGLYDIQKGFIAQKTRYDSEELTNDNISHFICRLAYCRNEDLRKWFVLQESRLFYYRLEACAPTDILQLLKDKCDMKYEQLSADHPDWKRKKDDIAFNMLALLKRDKKLKQAQLVSTAQDEHAMQFIKVPYKDALSLVSGRQVYLFKGFAYVHISDLNVIARTQFKNKLFSELNRAYKFLPTILQDQRLSQLLINLSNHNSIDFNLTEVSAPKDGDKIRLQDLDYYQRKSFPPCMKVLFTALRNQSHLKHFGRLQLGLYLKGLGLTVDESLQFWKKEFCKKIDSDKFEKNYAYNIRHSYGQEGKRNDYKPWNCSKVINQQPPATGEYHGCPFKTFGEDNMRQLLSTYGLTQSDMRVILDKKKENLYQVACLRLFEMSHPNAIADNVGNHPNAFFQSSVQYQKDMQKSEQRKSQAMKGGSQAPQADAKINPT